MLLDIYYLLRNGFDDDKIPGFLSLNLAQPCCWSPSCVCALSKSMRDRWSALGRIVKSESGAARPAGGVINQQDARSEDLYLIADSYLAMFAEYIKAAMDKATYEIIDDPEPFYGEIPDLKGVWATGKTPEACRDNLMSALEDWIAFRLRGRSIPTINGASIVVSAEPVSIVE
jgi:predicted RNase H-like HicB family nuclease